MDVIPLSPLDLSVAAFLVLAVAGLSIRMHLGLAGQILVAGIRTVIQLILIGFVLTSVFAHVHVGWVALISMAMFLIAGREVMGRQKRRFGGIWGFGVGALSMFFSSFSITILSLIVIIGPKPWYTPQYAIPLLGMLLGNTMTGIAVALDRLTQTSWEQRLVIDARLMLGQEWKEAIRDIQRESIRSGLIPIINAMAVAGVVSLPGMMTGQILAGSPPMEAVKYQILIMFLIASGTGFGTIAAVRIGARLLFDDRHRLRLDRLKVK
jgi:putative ABC transport system permease protein